MKKENIDEIDIENYGEESEDYIRSMTKRELVEALEGFEDNQKIMIAIFFKGKRYSEYSELDSICINGSAIQFNTTCEAFKNAAKSEDEK